MTLAEPVVPVKRGENWVEFACGFGRERIHWNGAAWCSPGTPMTDAACKLLLGAPLVGDDRRNGIPSWHPEAVST